MNINKLTWQASVLKLAKTRPTKTLLSLELNGFKTISDLLWLIPLRVTEKPKIKTFDTVKENHLFVGRGELLNLRSAPSFSKRGKGKIQLFNVTAIVRDTLSSKLITLQFFNTYPNLRKQLSELDQFTFMGMPSIFKGSLIIHNPKINPKELNNDQQYLVQYPTVNSISPNLIKKVIDLIPEYLWKSPLASPVSKLKLPRDVYQLNELFAKIHAKDCKVNLDRDDALEQLKYYELVEDQIKVMARKQSYKILSSEKIMWSNSIHKEFLSNLPYDLTPDQLTSIKDIQTDFVKGSPMMRILQGDVGCGKTTVAFASLIQAIESGYQVALMCPTEALSRQHEQSFKSLVQNSYNIKLLLGSNTQKERKEIYKELESGEIDLVIGTHSLFQDKVKFKKLHFVIIDEQHKFGVNQRLQLIAKGNNPHTLIMSATPIPRTLQLAQYGDLDISSIKTMPPNRIEIKTRIVTPSTFTKYLSFIKTRVSLKEQIYVVVPAIEESEAMDLENINGVFNEFIKYFPDLKIKCLHGKMSAEQKDLTLKKFDQGLFDILISTSVIEVGINILNATVMSIFNPDRFGLSSLHQLRGRVGRSTKASFCFLVTRKQLPQDSLKRLGVIEQSTDGFHIAQADLVSRGQGDLFGTNQSGSFSTGKLSNIILDFDLFNQVIQDMDYIRDNNNMEDLYNQYSLDKKVSSTI